MTGAPLHVAVGWTDLGSWAVVLMARRQGFQKVKELTQTPAARGSKVYCTHRTVGRPWGACTVQACQAFLDNII